MNDIYIFLLNQQPKTLCLADLSDVVCEFYYSALKGNVNDARNIFFESLKKIREDLQYIYVWSHKAEAPVGFERLQLANE